LHTGRGDVGGPSGGKIVDNGQPGHVLCPDGKKTLLSTPTSAPCLHHFFGLKREPGFAELFSENPDYDVAIRPSGKETCSVITAGIFSANPRN